MQHHRSTNNYEYERLFFHVFNVDNQIAFFKEKLNLINYIYGAFFRIVGKK